MHENAHKLDWKTQSKVACDYTWLLHGKIYGLDDASSEVFELEGSQVEGQSLQQKDKGEKEKTQKN